MRGLGRLVGLVSWLLTSTALAQSGPLWERGVELRAQGQDAEALRVFQEAHANEGTMATLAQVALAEQAIGAWGAAHRHLERALAQPDAWVSRNRAVLEQALGEIQGHTGSIQLVVDHDGARVIVEGEDVGRSPLGRIPVSAGSVSLRVERNGARVDRTVQVAVGQTVAEAVTLGDAGAGGGGGSPLPVVGGVLLGVGAAAAIGMTITWVLREDAAQSYNDDDVCLPPVGATRDSVCGPGSGMDYRSQTDSLTAATIGLAVGAGLLVGVGAVLLGVGASGGESAAIDCAPGGLGIACRGRF